jgi:hypothetical protein
LALVLRVQFVSALRQTAASPALGCNRLRRASISRRLFGLPAPCDAELLEQSVDAVHPLPPRFTPVTWWRHCQSQTCTVEKPLAISREQLDEIRCAYQSRR